MGSRRAAAVPTVLRMDDEARIDGTDSARAARHLADRGRRSSSPSPRRRRATAAPAVHRLHRRAAGSTARPRALAADIQFVAHRSGRPQPAAAPQRACRRRGGSCWIVHTGAADACRCAGAAPRRLHRRRARDQDASSCRHADRVARRRPTSPRSLSIRCTAPARRPARCGWSMRRGRAVQHVVNVMGRVRSCSPARRRARLSRLLSRRPPCIERHVRVPPAAPSRQPRLHPDRDC